AERGVFSRAGVWCCRAGLHRSRASVAQGCGVRKLDSCARKRHPIARFAGKTGFAHPTGRGRRAGLPAGSRHTLGAMVDRESSERDVSRPSPAAPVTEHELGHLRQYVPGDLLDVSFPVSVRGYERGAVDAYIRRVNRVIAELKVTASP